MGQILEETEAKPLAPSTEGTLLEIPFKSIFKFYPYFFVLTFSFFFLVKH